MFESSWGGLGPSFVKKFGDDEEGVAIPQIFCQRALLACTYLFLDQGSRQSIAFSYIKYAMNGQVTLRGEMGLPDTISMSCSSG